MEYPSRQNYSSHKRFCKTLTLEDDPQLIEDYKKVHAAGAAWPEITQGMIDVGIVDMEIYLAGTRLFMIMDTVPDFDHEAAMTELAKKTKTVGVGSLCFKVSEDISRCLGRREVAGN